MGSSACSSPDTTECDGAGETAGAVIARLLKQVEDQEDDQDEQNDSADSVEHPSLTSSARFASSMETTAKRRNRLRLEAALKSRPAGWRAYSQGAWRIGRARTS
jgi:hypothetical protein